MGKMGSERRKLEQLRVFFTLGLFMGVIGNISYFLNYIDVRIVFLNLIDIDGFTIIMILPVLITGLFCINNIKIDITEENLLFLKRKTLVYKIICMFFAIYLIAISIIFKDLSIIRLEILIEALLIFLYINERKIKSIQLTDIQLRWKRDYDYPGSLNKESNVFWRRKIRFFPRVRVKWNDRINRIRKYNILILGILLLVKSKLGILIFLIFSAADIIYFIEIIFGLYTKTNGICTGIIDVTNSKSRIPLYKVYITNYKSEEEITFKVRNYCYINERDEVVVVHGSISKRVIEVQGVRMDIL